MQDTSLDAIKDMVVGAGKDRAIVVSLGEGDRWWSTRLFLLASLLRSLTHVRQIVFCGRGDRFAGMASPDALLDGMGACFPILDLVARRLRESESTEDRVKETERQIAVWATVFSGTPSRPQAARQRPASTRGSISSRDPVPPLSERDAQVGVREELLLGWLGERLITRCIEVNGSLTISHVQQVIDCLVPDVPLEFCYMTGLASSGVGTDVEPPGRPTIKVIDRDSFGLEIAREWVRAGLPRNPVK